MADAPPPKSIGRYEIIREIGRGAMGVVYEARDAGLMRPVAVKTMSLAMSIPDSEREQFQKRFYQEARAAATLQHPGIVVVYEIGTDEATKVPFMALEFLRGRTMDKIVSEDGRLEWKEALRIVRQLAEALQHAHSQGVVHRDLKPANVMLLASRQPKIMDFGVAKLEGSQLTTQGQVFGSPSYMAPEQALEARADARSDLFSLGSLLYELLTGQRAFAGRGVSEILMRLAYEQPAAPSLAVPGLPPAIDAVVARALEKDPSRRYPGATAFAEDLDDLLSGRPPRHASAQRAPAKPSTSPAHAPKSAAPAKPATRLAPTPQRDVPTQPAIVAGSQPRAAPGPRPPAAAAPPRQPQPTARATSSTPPPGAEQTRVAGSGGETLAFPPGKRVSLAFLSGPRSGDVYVLEHPSVLIGREGGGAGAGIELADSQVSRAHAVFECHGSRFIVRDLESTNGTFVDGQRIREHELENHGEFQVGATRLMLILADAE